MVSCAACVQPPAGLLVAPPVAICGDGVVELELGEPCDDGNFAPGDGCDENCDVEAGWACDGRNPSTCVSCLTPGDLPRVPVLGPDTLDNANLITVSGQSLAAGSGGSPALSTQSLYPEVLRAGRTLPLCRLVEGPGDCGSGLNVEQPLAAMLDQLHTLDANRGFVGALAACDGCAYSAIQKGGTHRIYGALFDGTGAVASTCVALAAEGKRCRVAAAVMHHGERDEVEGQCGAYADAMLDYQADASADVAPLTGQQELVPLFQSQQHSWFRSGGSKAACALAQLDAAESRSDRIVLCTPKYHLGSRRASIYADGVHLTNVGYQLLAEKMGHCIWASRIRGVRWSPVVPACMATFGERLVVSYAGNIPCAALGTCESKRAPLAADTWSVALAHTGDQGRPLYGFELDCPGVARPPHLVAAWVGRSEVVLDADRPVPRGCFLSYAYSAIPHSPAGNGNDGAAYGSARGNLRDTETTLGRRTGQKLWTWAATFRRPIPSAVEPRGGLTSPLRDRSWTWTSTDCAAHAGDRLDRRAPEDLWIRRAGTWARPRANAVVLEWQADQGGEGNVWRIIAGPEGTLHAWVRTERQGGPSLAVTLERVVPETPEVALADLYVDARGFTGRGSITFCYAGRCKTEVAQAPFPAQQKGRFTAGASCEGARFAAALGEAARSQWSEDVHRADAEVIRRRGP